jgi:hypothetical protein
MDGCVRDSIGLKMINSNLTGAAADARVDQSKPRRQVEAEIASASDGKIWIKVNMIT